MKFPDYFNGEIGEGLISSLEIPLPPDTSEESYKVVFAIIEEFERKVPDTHIPCANFTVSPFRIALMKVQYYFPDILVFYGRSLPDGAFVHIVQHIYQLTLSLIAVPKPDNLERPPIGFEVGGKPRT